MTMVERMAQALKDTTDTFHAPVRFYIEPEAQARWEKENPDGDWYEQPQSDDKLASYKIIARAVIEAMREPTDEILRAGERSFPDSGTVDHTDDLRSAWRVMIDAALDGR